MVSGTVGEFHTDARVFNPSFDKDITISATFLPRRNTDNTARTPVTFTVPKRQMKVLNDVTSVLFNSQDLGAIRFTSDDEFEVTSRIYALKPNGTLGQFGPGLPTSSGKAKGALLQLKVNAAFRTNVGVVNPNAEPVTVTWTLYATDNSVASTGTTDMPPLAVIDPLSLNGGFFFTPTTKDLGDTWLSYSTSGSKPIFVYASVIDNSTTDQTFVPAVDDKGIPPTQPPPMEVNFEVELEDFSIIWSPVPNSLKQGDTVTLRITNRGSHGFQLVAPNGATLVSALTIPTGGSVIRTFAVGQTGTYGYFCTNSACDIRGSGHNAMAGVFTVGPGSDGPGRDY